MIDFLLFRVEWPASIADIHRQRLYLSIKNNSPLFAQEQTYMGDVSKEKKRFQKIFYSIYF
jgi:hypothetical protein